MQTYEDLSLNDQLLFSVQHGDIIRVKECLEKGAKIHQHPKNALFLATKNGYDEIVKLLFDYGADPSTIISGETALFGIKLESCRLGIYDDVILPDQEKTCEKSRVKTAIELIKHGVNPNHKDMIGETVLVTLIDEDYGDDIVMILTLIREGANPYIKDDDGQTVLDYNNQRELKDFIETNHLYCCVKKSK